MTLIDHIADLMRAAAYEHLLPNHGRVAKEQIFQHTDGSAFTTLDLLVEAQLTKGIQALLPGAVILGEEAIGENPEAVLKQAREQTVVIIDPIDGTGGFCRGDGTYGMTVAVIDKGVTVAACIYSPGRTVTDHFGKMKAEKDFTFIGEKGVGCFMNSERIRLDDIPAMSLIDAQISFACRNQDKKYEALLADKVPGYRPRNNASNDYEKLLFGGVHATFFSEGFTPALTGKCPPWDHAAGVFMMQEAGGYAALPYNDKGGVAYDPLGCHDRVLACCNREMYDDVYRHIKARAPELLQPRTHKAIAPVIAPPRPF